MKKEFGNSKNKFEVVGCRKTLSISKMWLGKGFKNVKNPCVSLETQRSYGIVTHIYLGDFSS
jgi:hypothetical protein